MWGVGEKGWGAGWGRIRKGNMVCPKILVTRQLALIEKDQKRHIFVHTSGNPFSQLALPNCNRNVGQTV